ncbi:MAG TPA: TRAP transporter small permease subunit [Trueperaceae bacterium]|nr:TRAP transporter small permease subunit [Trueperaceae bacterium]
MKFFLALARGIDAFTTTVGRLMWWLTLFMVLVGVYNVLTRYGFHVVAAIFGQAAAEKASGNTYLELQTYSFNLVFLLGAAYVLRTDGHVRVDVVFTNLSGRVKAWIDIIATAVFLVPFSLMGIYFSHHYVAASWRVHEMSPNPGGLARYPIKTVIVIAFAMLIAQGISEVIKNIAFLSGRKGSRSMYATDELDVQDESAVRA